MKIAILDMVFNEGHHNINNKIIDYLTKENEVFVVHNHYYDSMDNAHYIQCDKIIQKTGKISARIASYKALLEEYKMIEKYNVDYIFILSCEWVSLSFLISKMLKKSKVGVLHHNLNQFDNNIKYFFFKKYSNKIDNIVLDDCLSKPLKDKYEVDEKNIFVFRHPQTLKSEGDLTKRNYCSQLSGSLNQNIIDELYKKINLVKADVDFTLLIKNNKYELKKDNLIFRTGRINEPEYSQLFAKSFAMIFSFPIDFQYRVSSVLLSAIVDGKIVISNRNFLVESLKAKYPSLVYVYDTTEQLIHYINNVEKLLTNNEIVNDLEKARRDRDEHELCDAINRIVKHKSPEE